MTTEIEVEILSKEQIKPCSVTPHHLRHLQLSFLDELQPRTLMPFVLFYPQNPTISSLERSNLLKKSLSNALTIFYPLAGRVRNNTHIDCNDEGVPFTEAKSNCRLSDVLENKNSSFQLYKFVPVQAIDETGDLAACFQVTFFDCGGCAISFAMSHKLGDALSHFIFLNGWAAVARGNKVDIPPFGSASLFPPKRLPEMVPITKEKIILRVFGFEADTISMLRAKYSINGEKLSRIQALATFLWSRFMAVAQAKYILAVDAQYIMVHAVNLRPKMVPPMPEVSFGNLCRIAAAMADKNDIYGYKIAREMKEAIENVNADFVEKLQKSDDHLNFLKEKSSELDEGKLVNYSFTSLCNFPIYEADFGWGKPEWVTPLGGMFFQNLVIFVDAKDGEGVEAWISLTEDEMAKFEVDDELLSHVSSSSNGKLKNSKMDARSRL